MDFENPNNEVIAQLFKKMMKVIKDDKKDSETRLIEMQAISEISYSKDKDIDNVDTLQPTDEEQLYEIKQVTFPTKEDEYVESRKKNLRLTTPESTTPFDTITRLQLTKRVNMISPFKARRQSTLRKLTEIGMESKPYLDNTPVNGHHQWGYANKLSPNKIDLSQHTLKDDCPLALIGVAITAASGTYLPVFKNFDDIDETYNFEYEFVHDKRYADNTSKAMFTAVGQKLAFRFEEKDFSDPIHAPEATQVIETFRLHDNGWHILQSFFETLHPKHGAQLDNFDPFKDLATLRILPNETMSEFLLRCTIIRKKFTMTKGETPFVRIMDKVVNCLHRAPGLSMALATIMTTIT